MMFQPVFSYIPLLIAGLLFQSGIGCAASPPATKQTAACSYALSPADSTFSSEGGVGTLKVASAWDCPWSAKSNAPAWITLISGTPGRGGGAVSYRVAANTGISRSGTIAVAGRIFTVYQTAPPCCDVPSPQGGAAR